MSNILLIESKTVNLLKVEETKVYKSKNNTQMKLLVKKLQKINQSQKQKIQGIFNGTDSSSFHPIRGRSYTWGPQAGAWDAKHLFESHAKLNFQ